MTTPGQDVADTLQECLRTMRQQRKAAGKQYENLVNKMNHMMNSPAAKVLCYVHLEWYQIEKAFRRFKHDFEVVTKRVDEALKHEAPVISLVYTSMQWQDHVHGPLIDVRRGAAHGDAGGDRDGDDANIAYWKGTSRNAYNSARADQLAAADASADDVSKVRKYLMKVASHNVEVATTLLKILTDMVTKIVKVVGDSFAITELGGVISGLADDIGGLVQDMIVLTGTAAAAVLANLSNLENVIDQLQKGRKALPKGGWPVSVRT